RQAVGGELVDLGLHQPWLVVDVTLTEPVDLPSATVQYCDPARPITFVKVTGARRRWEIMLMPGDDPAEMARPERVWALLSRWIGPRQARLDRCAIYTFHSLIAPRWRNGRLFIAGDSAHQTPPFLGQGMCTGIRDAANLAWKLAAVHQGAPEALLDTYESERMPHARAFIDKAVALGNIIQTTDPAVAAERDAHFARDGAGEIVNLSPSLGPGLHNGPVGGTIPSQPRLSDGRLMDDAIGQRFALLGRIPPRLAEQAATLGAVRIEDPAIANLLTDADAEGLVLRPDRIVLGTAEDPVTADLLNNLASPAPCKAVRSAG
ncbi:MAG: FAD-dependent monooxygenase, partial [Rhodobacteraceae bacterium]|nr:FAD-dependent monooxygenase [Paracoccaceae bacterium]